MKLFFFQNYFDIQLNQESTHVNDPDPLLPCDLLESQSKFNRFFWEQERMLEFSDIRQSHFATMTLVRKLKDKIDSLPSAETLPEPSQNPLPIPSINQSRKHGDTTVASDEDQEENMSVSSNPPSIKPSANPSNANPANKNPDADYTNKDETNSGEEGIDMQDNENVDDSYDVQVISSVSEESTIEDLSSGRGQVRRSITGGDEQRQDEEVEVIEIEDDETDNEEEQVKNDDLLEQTNGSDGQMMEESQVLASGNPFLSVLGLESVQTSSSQPIDVHPPQPSPQLSVF